MIHRYKFPRDRRLKDKLVFERATRRGERLSRGPLVFFAVPAATATARLGIRISRRCGTAPRRNRVKRLLREAYRLLQNDWAIAVDLVISVRPHAPLSLREYQRLLGGAMAGLGRKVTPPPASPPTRDDPAT